MFFSHKYTLNTINITYTEIKKKSRSRFFKPQQARVSLIFKNKLHTRLLCYLDQLGLLQYSLSTH